MKGEKSTESRLGGLVMSNGPSDGFICSCDVYGYGEDDETAYACDSRGMGA